MNARHLAFAASSLGRRRAKTAALLVGLSFAVTLLAGVLFLTESLRAEAGRARAAMPDIVVQKLVGGRPRTIPESAGAAITKMPSVARVRPRVWGYVFLPALSGNVTVVGVSPEGAQRGDLAAALVSGRDLTPGAHEMVLGKDLAKFLGLRDGDELTLPSADRKAPPLKVVGAFGSAVELYAADVIFCDEADARLVLGVPAGEATDLAVDVKNPDETRVLVKTISDGMPDARVVDKASMQRVYELAYGRRSGLVLAACIPALLALFVLAWDRLSGMGPAERKEIAILKAVGFSTRDVLFVKLGESLVVSGLATLLGLVLAYGWIFVLGAPGLRGALVGWSVLYPEAPLTPAVGVAEILGIAALSMGPFVLLAVVPAWRAAIVDPMDAMRG
ncbi:MAG: ABC transporter permease [Myxococcales bacterium]|nr:ABC transporter permease [Myxococcales bacterium]